MFVTKTFFKGYQLLYERPINSGEEVQVKDTVERQLERIKRGTVEIISEDELVERLKDSIKNNRPLRIKAGFDPTAPDIHLGHTVLLQKMKVFQDLGHRVIFLIGDFTGMIGDPTGRVEARPPLTREEVLKNSETYTKQVFKILDKDRTEIVFNSEWMDRIDARRLIEIASKYTVARMLERNDFHERFKSGKPISIHEFLYPLIQGYDSYALEADVELGGTDQKFNLLVGRDLQREFGQRPQVVITLPLLEGTDGRMKMSKSYGNYIGVDEPPEDIFGKIMSISDELMIRYFELLTDVSSERLEMIKRGDISPREAKEELALEITSRFHGREAAESAREHFYTLFVKKEMPEDIKEIDIKGEDGAVWLPRLLTIAGFTSSNSEARRLIKQGGVSIDGKKVLDEDIQLEAKGPYLIRVGKRRYGRVSFH